MFVLIDLYSKFCGMIGKFYLKSKVELAKPHPKFLWF